MGMEVTAGRTRRRWCRVRAIVGPATQLRKLKGNLEGPRALSFTQTLRIQHRKFGRILGRTLRGHSRKSTGKHGLKAKPGLCERLCNSIPSRTEGLSSSNLKSCRRLGLDVGRIADSAPRAVAIVMSVLVAAYHGRIVKWASVGCRAKPLMGKISWGQHDIATTTLSSARNTT